ncbi:MAG: porin [Flavobacteriales bacterium]|nr:porin [Flavobacteriales bacterium]
MMERAFRMKWSASLVGCVSWLSLHAQITAPLDSARHRPEFSGFVDVYHVYDIALPEDGYRPSFLYNHNRSNEVALNLGLAQVEYENDRLRTALGLMVGTYPQANLSAEPPLLRNVYEARIGFKLHRTKAIWLDAGVFSSHLGMESAVSMDDRTLTRSLNAENSPYYLSGAKVTWTISSKLEVAGLFVNGWQRMQRVQQYTPCFGTQVLWTMKKGTQFNWSTFLGSDTPDSLGLYRVFNNFWWSWEGEKWGVKLAADVGVQEAAIGNEWDQWSTGVAILRRRVTPKLYGVGRVEFFKDPEQVVVTTGYDQGLSTMGYSLGLDLEVMPEALVRIEGRWFQSEDPVFVGDPGPVKDNAAVTLSMAARF